MKKYGGYLIHFDEGNRTERLYDRIGQDGKFSDTLSAPDWEPKEIEICLVSWDGKSFEHASLVRRGRKVATAKYRVELFRFVNLRPSISFEQIEREVGTTIADYLIATSKGVGVRLSSDLWDKVIGAIKKSYPSVASELDDFERIRASSKTSYDNAELKLVAEEKDAISLAVSLAGFDRSEALADYTVVPGERVMPFISGLQEVSLREDTMIIHDARTLPEWHEIKRHIIGATLFEKDGKKLTVMNVNRMPIEKTLGVDLLYYHPACKSFVMVQYKRMTREGAHGMCYRPKDVSYLKEIQRMRDFKAAYPDKCDEAILGGYRLNPECFYFKICEEVQFEPYSKDLIKGMYIPLEFWEPLMSSPDVKGEREGVVVSYETVKRYLSNSLFISLLQDSWIGTRGATTAAVLELVSEWVGKSHSVIFAIEEHEPDDQ